jgi:hypothetical protein
MLPLDEGSAMRATALTFLAVLATTASAQAAIDLGPVGFGFHNKITVLVEQDEIGRFADDFTFTVVGAPKPILNGARISIDSDLVGSFSRPSLLLETFAPDQLTRLAFGSGGGEAIVDSTKVKLIRLSGEVVSLPASYSVSIAVTPVPQAIFLLATGLAGLMSVAIRRNRGHRGAPRGKR